MGSGLPPHLPLGARRRVPLPEVVLLSDTVFRPQVWICDSDGTVMSHPQPCHSQDHRGSGRRGPAAFTWGPAQCFGQ